MSTRCSRELPHTETSEGKKLIKYLFCPTGLKSSSVLRYTLRLVDPLYTKLGFTPRDSDTHLDTKLRSKAISWACSMGNEECKKQAGDTFKQWMYAEEPDLTGANP